MKTLRGRFLFPVVALAAVLLLCSCLAGVARAIVIPTNFNGYGSTVSGYQDFFSGDSLNTDWKVAGRNAFTLDATNDLLRVTSVSGDPNHLLYELHFRQSGGEGKQGLKECAEFAFVWGVRQSGVELFFQHFTGNRAAAVGMRGTTVGVVPGTRSAIGQLGLLPIPAA